MKILVILFLFAWATSASAEVLVKYEASNKVKASVAVEVTQDTSTHLYTYSYIVSNDKSSEQRIANLAIEIHESTPVMEAIAPKGWSFRRYVHQNIFEFSSTEGITEEHRVDLPGGGYEIRSPYDIDPGESLCCFVFKTFAAPEQGNAYIQGYAPIPQSTGDEEYEPDFAEAGVASDNIVDNSFKTTTEVPNTPLYDGNRRPAVDGFVAPVNIHSANKDQFVAPATIYITFALNDEEVFTDTFYATLNGVDVTSRFKKAQGSFKSITLALDETSPLEVGSNTLVLSVEGVVPGADRHAVDTDKIRFEVLQN